MRKWILILMVLSAQVFSQTLAPKVINLHYLSAKQAMDLLKPLLTGDEQMSGEGQTLILKVAAHTLSDIRSVLHQIDVPPVTFSITVYQGEANWLSSQGDVVASTQSHAQTPSSQTVSVLNGQTALVSMGNQIPIVKALGIGFYSGVIYQQHEVQTGLLVRPLLQGKQVKLSVYRIRQQQNVPGSQQFGEQELATTIMAPLNQWISLGTASGSDNVKQNANVYSTKSSFIKTSTLFVKVSIANGVP